MGVITIAGGKGGVGKTTTVASIAVALHDAGESVALVDADLSMANLAEIVDVEHEEGVHQVLAGEADVADVSVEVEDGFTVVPGDHGLDIVSEADPANLRDVVDPLVDDYDTVLVDTGAGLDHETLVATGLADAVLLATTPHRESIADTAKTAEFVEHADANCLGAVVTMAEPDTDLADVADRLDMPLYGVIPEDPTLATDPAIDGDAGRAYRALTATMLAHCRGEACVAASPQRNEEAGETGLPVDADDCIERETAAIGTAPAPDASAVTDSPAVATDGGRDRPESTDGLLGTILSLVS